MILVSVHTPEALKSYNIVIYEHDEMHHNVVDAYLSLAAPLS